MQLIPAGHTTYYMVLKYQSFQQQISVMFLITVTHMYYCVYATFDFGSKYPLNKLEMYKERDSLMWVQFLCAKVP